MEKELENEKALREASERRVLELEQSLAELRRKFENIKEPTQATMEVDETERRERQRLEDEALARQRQELEERATRLSEHQRALSEQQESLHLQQENFQSNIFRRGSPMTVISNASIPSAAVERTNDVISGSSKLPFAMTVDQLPKFSADDPTVLLKNWIDRVCDDAVIYSWSEEEKFFAAKRALDGSAKKWLERQRGLTSWATMKEGLEATFGRKVRLADIHEAMRLRRKRVDETVTAFVEDVEVLGAQAAMEREEVKHYIIQGFTQDVQMRVMLTTATDHQQLMNMLETFDRESKRVAANSKPANQQRRINGKIETRVCYKCKRGGHIAKNCDSGGTVICYRCGQAGHFKKDCPSYVKPVTENESVSETVKNATPRINNVCDSTLSVNRSTLRAVIEGVEVQALIDSGADLNILRHDLFLRYRSRVRR